MCAYISINVEFVHLLAYLDLHSIPYLHNFLPILFVLVFVSYFKTKLLFKTIYTNLQIYYFIINL